MSKQSTGWGEGRIYLRGSRWWIDYSVRGKRQRESGGKTETEARRKLKKRLREIYGDRFVGPKEERLEIDDLLDSLVVNLETRGAKAIASVKSHLKPVREHLGMLRAVDLTATRVERFVHERLRDGKAPATTNREVGALKQALNLARKQGRLSRVPYIPMLREDNARQGFFERAESEAVVANLPGPIDDIARFAYLCGWRKGEILGLRWSAVDRSGGEIRLQAAVPLAG